ncbi:MAG: hypothetical protein JWR75_117 [Devosia sp.]|nr:hypothetical protein [Devosia sp.]
MRETARETLRCIYADGPIYGFVALYVIAGSAFVMARGQAPFGMLASYALTWTKLYLLAGPIIVLVLGIVRIIHQFNSRRQLAFRTMFSPRAISRFIAGTLLMMGALMPFVTTFSAVKSALPGPGGYLYDVLQADIDRFIHFGVDPWVWLYDVARFDMVLKLVEVNYNLLWMVLWHAIFFWVAISRRADGIRVRYAITFFASWILIGNIFAGFFLSAGPAFYGEVTGDFDRFARQFAWLNANSDGLTATVDFQGYLWHLYSEGAQGIGSGISAFPSMHVAVVTLNAWVIGEASPRWAGIAWVYVAFIVLSSTYLGWHYAIDGYASTLLATAIYWAIRALFSVASRFGLTRRQVAAAYAIPKRPMPSTTPA